MAGESASPSWYANVNPGVVVLLVGLVTPLMRRHSALSSMTVGMLIMPLLALCMAAGNLIGAEQVPGMHPGLLRDFPSYLGVTAVFAFWGLSTILLFWAALQKATRISGGDEQGQAFGLLDGGRGLLAICSTWVTGRAFCS